MAVFDPSKGKPAVAHAGTFTANPLSMVAGAAAIAALTPEAFDRLAALRDLAREGLRRASAAAGPASPVTRRRPLFLLHPQGGPLQTSCPTVPPRAQHGTPRTRPRADH